MQSSANDPVEDAPVSKIPDDVAALYLWANLQDATYLDFSVARRKLRAQRRQAAQEQAKLPDTGNAVDGTPQGQADQASNEPDFALRPMRSPVTEATLTPSSDLRTSPPPVVSYPSDQDELQTTHILLQDSPATGPSEAPGPRDEGTQDRKTILHMAPFSALPVDSPEIHAMQMKIPKHAAPSRWHALASPMYAFVPEPAPALKAPILAVFAPAAGSGKTVLVATLGRALSLRGESVTLAQTSFQSNLPACFGVHDLPPHATHVVVPTPGNPITLINYPLAIFPEDSTKQGLLVDRFLKLDISPERLLIDLTERAGWFLHCLGHLDLTVLIPVVPTMSSVISLQAVERFFRDIIDSDGIALQPHYLIVQFDEAFPIHRDVRDFLHRRVGDRLLPIVIRSATGVPQALAHGMTVLDYAPNSPVASDYRAVADWLRDASPAIPPAPPPPRRHASRWAARRTSS